MTTPASMSFDAKSMAEYYGCGAWRHRTTLDDLHERASAHGSDIFSVTRHVATGEEHRLTLGQLDDAVVAIAQGLLELGVERGEVVSFQIPNWWEFTALYLACVQVGAVANPIVPIMRKREVEQILRTVKSRILFVPARFRHYDYISMAVELRQALPALEHIFVVGGEATHGIMSLSDFFLSDKREAIGVKELARRASGPDDIAVVKFTSGTTGQPKGVLHTHNTLFATTRAVPELMDLDSSDVVIMPSPLVHMSGFLYGVLMPVTWGMKVVYQDIWDGTAMVDLIEQEKATWTMGATPYVIDMLDVLGQGRHDISSFRTFSCSGAPIPRYLTQACDQAGFALRPAWGMTETGAVTFVPRNDTLGKASTSDGIASKWMSVKVVDESGEPTSHEAEGSLLVRGASRFLGYFQHPEMTATAVDGEGWLDTGDLASMDADGYIQVTGRKKDIVIRGGENVPVVEIENALYQHPKVKDVAVVGYPDPRLGERAVAVVVPRGSAPTLAELLDHLESLGVTKHYWPERLEIIEKMPRTDAGKIQKFVLRDQLR